MTPSENAVAALTCGLVDDVVRNFGEARLRVSGTSMVPSILPGALICVQRTKISEVFTGEVVVYSRDGRLIVHRVVGIAGTNKQALLVTRGDRITRNDAPISSAELLGRVTSVQYDHESQDRQVQSTLPLNLWKQIILRILQKSDRATYLYLRIASLWPSFILGRESCQT